MRAVLLYTRLIDSPLGIWWWRVIVAGLLALMWLSAALALTFVGPFLDTGNGYFAVQRARRRPMRPASMPMPVHTHTSRQCAHARAYAPRP